MHYNSFNAQPEFKNEIMIENPSFLIFVTNRHETDSVEKMLKEKRIAYAKKPEKLSEKNILGITFYVGKVDLEKAKEGVSGIYDNREYAFIKDKTESRVCSDFEDQSILREKKNR